ncbi:hypothetical protein A7J71_17775 [Achromobacter insolitus]|nr:hypothetical protein A7J71_17775 [Achromobacter insolitus]OCZ50691.1 hypothetical protein A7P22_15560 [Achromobacter insolitus]
MPLALTDGCTPQHWNDVRNILTEAVEGIESPKFVANMVSSADEVAVIQANIVKNLYANEVVVCDVSGRNANVMFELGMRLAFDKPTVIVKDDKTDYSFDTLPVEHIPYPRDLRYAAVQEFKAKLSEKVLATYEHHRKSGNGAGYLASFGPIKVAKMDTQEVGPMDILLTKMNELQSQISRMSKREVIRPAFEHIVPASLNPSGVTSKLDLATDAVMKRLQSAHNEVGNLTKQDAVKIAEITAESFNLNTNEAKWLAHRAVEFMI